MPKNIPNRLLTDEIIACQQSNSHPNEVSDKLADYLLTMCINYSWKGNFRGYSYRQDFVSEALIQLISPGNKNPIPPVLRFDPNRAAELTEIDGKARQVNGFAYCTTIIHNAFLRLLKKEKRHTEIRDDLLVMAGVNPSYTRMGDNEDNRSSEPIEPKPERKKRGRKAAPKSDKPVKPPGKRGPKARPYPK